MIPDKTILYLVFNKKNQVEAQNEFPPNTQVMTTNSFCGKVVYNMFKCKLKENKTMMLIPKDYYSRLEKT